MLLLLLPSFFQGGVIVIVVAVVVVVVVVVVVQAPLCSSKSALLETKDFSSLPKLYILSFLFLRKSL